MVDGKKLISISLILIGIFFITLPISLLTSRLIMREINR